MQNTWPYDLCTWLWGKGYSIFYPHPPRDDWNPNPQILKKWNLKGSFFSQHLWQICQLLWRNNLNPLFKNLSSLEVLLIKLTWNIPKLRASSWSSVIVFIIIINIFHVITEPKGWHGSVLHVVYQYTERTKMRSDNRQYRYSI